MIVLVLILVLLAGGVAEAGIPNTAGWHNLGVNMNSACHFISGAWPSGCNIIEAWGNAGYDSRRGRLFFTGGGHSDGRGNELIALSIGTSNAVTDTQSAVRLKDGTSFTSLGTCTQSGSWRSFHSWNMAFVKGRDSTGADSSANDRYVWSIQGTSDAGDMGMDCFVVYNPNTGTHTITTHHADLALWRASGWWGGAFANDERQGKLVALSGQSILYWDVVNGWTKPTQTEWFDSNSDGPYKHGVIDPVRKRYYAIGRGQIWWWNISGTGTIQRNVVSVPASCATAVAGMDDGHAPGMDYYPYRDRIVIWRGGTTVYLLDPATHTCTSVTSPGGTGPTLPSNIHMIAGRFRFVPKDNLFVTCNNTADPGTGANEQCYALRLDVKTSTTDFLTRARWHGVTHYQGFEDPAHLTDGEHYFLGSAGTAGRALDTSIKSSGNSSFRMTIPAGHASDTPSGEWRECFSPPTCSVHTGGNGFGPGETLGNRMYWSYRIRVDTAMVNNTRIWGAGTSRTGWKHANIHNMPQGSCGPLELTGTITTLWAPVTQIWYYNCSPGFETNSSGSMLGGGGPWVQQGNLTQSTSTNGFWCTNPAPDGSGTGQGCFNWQWANEWLTVIGEAYIPCWDCAQSTVKVWIKRDSSDTLYQVVNVKDHTWSPLSGATNRRFNQISFTNYMTGNNKSAPTTANMWIDEFIVSQAPIEFTASSSESSGNTPPAAPTNIRVSALVQ